MKMELNSIDSEIKSAVDSAVLKRTISSIRENTHVDVESIDVESIDVESVDAAYVDANKSTETNDVKPKRNQVKLSKPKGAVDKPKSNAINAKKRLKIVDKSTTESFDILNQIENPNVIRTDKMLKSTKRKIVKKKETISKKPKLSFESSNNTLVASTGNETSLTNEVNQIENQIFSDMEIGGDSSSQNSAQLPPRKRHKQNTPTTKKPRKTKVKPDIEIDISKAILVGNMNGSLESNKDDSVSKSTTDNESLSLPEDENLSAIIHEAVLSKINISSENQDNNDTITSNGDYVPLYESSKSIDEKDFDVPQTKTKERKTKEIKNWQFKCEFANAEIAKSALQQEDAWSILRKRDTADGLKWFYRCNKAKLREKQCSAQVYHLFKNDSEIVLEFRTNAPHDHGTNIDQKTKLKEEVEKLFKLHQKPNEIMHLLSEIDGLILPKKSQLINMIAELRKKKFGPPTISMQELTTWLEEHSEIPEDDHKAFVLCYEVNFENLEPYFRFMITTKYLLNLAKLRNVTHCDATYKCIWQGFPVFMIGTTDLDKAYHSYALSVCSNEKTADFRFVFEGIKNGLQRVHNYEMHQTTLICDAAFAIINAFIEIYGDDVTIIMCWFHAKTAMEDHLTLVKKVNRTKILEDIEFLHLAQSSEIFYNAVKVFLKKWMTEEQEYCKYFQSEWIEKHPNWYLGAAEFTPCHNNALEACNRYLKDTNTIRIRHPLRHFLEVTINTTHKWSKRYVIDLKSFALTPTISTKSWTDSYNWARSNIKAKIISQDDETMTVVIDAEIVRAKQRQAKDAVLRHSITEIMNALREERKIFQAIRQIRGHKSLPEVENELPKKGLNEAVSINSSTSQLSVTIAHQLLDRVSVPINSSTPQKSHGVVDVAKKQCNEAVPINSNTSQLSPSVSQLSVPVPINSSTQQSKSIDEFEKYKQSFMKWTVTISKRQDSLTEGRCNCPAFAKEYICKHVIGLSIRMKYVTAPLEARTVPCGEKRKRGRPTKTKPALFIQ